MSGPRRILVVGYGNPGREDDGLGPAIAAQLEALSLPGVETQDPYQLSIEDAVDIAAQDVVWFIDAARAGYEPYAAHPIAPASTIDFDSHHLTPQTLLAITEQYCGKAPEAWLLGVRGYSFEFRLGLSERAKFNLEQALAFMSARIGAGAQCAAQV